MSGDGSSSKRNSGVESLYDIKEFIDEDERLSKNNLSNICNNPSYDKLAFSSENLLKPERNTKSHLTQSKESIEDNTHHKERILNKDNVTISPTKTEIDKFLSTSDDSSSIILTVTAIDDIADEEVVSEIDEDINEYMNGESINSNIGKIANSTNGISSLNNAVNKSNDANNIGSISLDKMGSSNQVNNDTNTVEKNLKKAIDKELSYNYLDENEKLFESIIDKEQLLKEYINIRKKFEKYIMNNQNNTELYLNEGIEDIAKVMNYCSNQEINKNEENKVDDNSKDEKKIVEDSDKDEKKIGEDNNKTKEEKVEEEKEENINTENKNSESSQYESNESINANLKSIMNSLDNLMEQVIENEKINERYKKRMNELIELKNKLINRQRIRNNRLEFALKEALFFLQKPYDVDVVQVQFLNTLLANFKENPDLFVNNNTNNPSSTTNNSVTAQAKKYLKKINKKHETKLPNPNIVSPPKISKEENELCLQFSVTYLKQALDWLEKDVDVDDNYDKFKIKRYISVDKIPKSDENQPNNQEENQNNDINEDKNNINLSYSNIKINYQKGLSKEDLTNINLEDYFDKSFTYNKRPTLKKSNTFQRDKSSNDSKFSTFTKSKSANSLFIAQFNASENVKYFNNEREFENIHESDFDINNVDHDDIIIENKLGSSESSLYKSSKSFKSSHKNMPILIKPLNADSEYNNSNREGGENNTVNQNIDSNENAIVKRTSTRMRRSLSLNAKENHLLYSKIYNMYLEENNMINIIISGDPNNDSSSLVKKPELLSNFKFISTDNIEDICENFEKYFPETNNNSTYYFCINGEDGMEIFKKVMKALDHNHPEKYNIDKNNFVTSIEYNEQLKKIEELEKDNNTLKYQLEKKTLEYDHEHMAKVMLDKELEDLTSQLFLQANKLVETECHKLEDTKIRLKELNDKYNNVKSQLEKRENELNGLKKTMIKYEEKKVQKRTKLFPKLPTANGQLEKINSEEAVNQNISSTSFKINNIDNTSSSLGVSPENFTSVLSHSINTNSINELLNESSKNPKELSNINSVNSEILSDSVENIIDEKKSLSNKVSIDLEQTEDIHSWNLYSTKVMAIKNDAIYSYIDGGQFNEFQNYIRDSLIKVNNNKKKKSNIFCLPNTSFMKRCIEDEIYPCLFEHRSYDQQTSIQSKRNSITKTHVNFKKKLQKALVCNGVIILPYELLNKTGKLIKYNMPVVANPKDKSSNNFTEYNIDDSNDDIKDNENNGDGNDSHGSKKMEYYIEYDYVHPLPLPPRKKCCLCMNYKDCHYRVIFKNIEGKDGGLPFESSKIINAVNVIYNNNITNNIPNTQDNITADSIPNKNNEKDYTNSPALNTQSNKNDLSTNIPSKTVEDYTAKCYNITGEFLNQLRMENSASYNEQFYLCPICRDKIVSVADLYSYLNSLESKLTGSSKGQSSILNMFKNVILLKRRIATAKLGALQFLEKNNDLFKDESLSALYDNSSEEWENYVKIL